MPKPGPGTTYKYSEKFKATAVKLSELPGVNCKYMADSLCIHPFMLSRWRKEYREGLIMAKGVQINQSEAAELKRLHKLEKDYKRLQLEHEFLKKLSSGHPNESRCFQFIDDHREAFPAPVMCKLHGVSHGGYYEWRNLSVSGRTIEDGELISEYQQNLQ